MRKLGSVAPEVLASLERVRQILIEREIKEPGLYPINCETCSDTGFAISLDFHHGMNRNYSVGRACPDCTLGDRIATRLHKEKAAKVVVDFKEAKREKINKRVRAEYDAPVDEDDSLPF